MLVTLSKILGNQQQQQQYTYIHQAQQRTLLVMVSWKSVVDVVMERRFHAPMTCVPEQTIRGPKPSRIIIKIATCLSWFQVLARLRPKTINVLYRLGISQKQCFRLSTNANFLAPKLKQNLTKPCLVNGLNVLQKFRPKESANIQGLRKFW